MRSLHARCMHVDCVFSLSGAARAGCGTGQLARLVFLVGRVALTHLVHIEQSAAKLQAQRAAAEKAQAESATSSTGELLACEPAPAQMTWHGWELSILHCMSSRAWQTCTQALPSRRTLQPCWTCVEHLLRPRDSCTRR